MLWWKIIPIVGGIVLGIVIFEVIPRWWADLRFRQMTGLDRKSLEFLFNQLTPAQQQKLIRHQQLRGEMLDLLNEYLRRNSQEVVDEQTRDKALAEFKTRLDKLTAQQLALDKESP